jgi:hypothetical protein
MFDKQIPTYMPLFIAYFLCNKKEVWVEHILRSHFFEDEPGI